MNDFNVALLQLMPTGTLGGNLAKGIKACEVAKQNGADLALFPEMWSHGYNVLLPENHAKEWKATALDPNGDFVQTFAKLAGKLKMAIAITLLEKTKGQPKNTVIVFDRFGKQILKYSKVHTTESTMENHVAPGTSFDVATLDYGRGKVKIGSMICFDRNFPEAARILMLNGAEIILSPNACELLNLHMCVMKTRAVENHIALFTTNYPLDPNDKYIGNGQSCAFTPIFRNKRKLLAGSKEIDTTIIRMSEDESIGMAPIDLAALRENRAKGGNGNAFRKPRMYAKLLDEKVEPPFVRKWARR
ncbi:MAG: carbon-nitrogen hydrolase family protein [Alphaproteobacteria bacterium]|nr:carbon-nitrogen hydrolase family protein [Alphaproteobacteria bacterium]